MNALAPGDASKKTMFANSGAEAVENAVKIARKATGRQAVVTFDHAFHVRTPLAMSPAGKIMPYKQGMGPFALRSTACRSPTPTAGRAAPTGAPTRRAYAREEIHKHIGDGNVAAIILEPIQG